MMCLKDNHYECLQFLAPLTTLIVYIAGFAFEYWVTTDNVQYGLWKRCIRDDGEGNRKCYDFFPGEGDAYFEVVRVLSCLAFVFYFLGLIAICRAKDRPNKICQFYNPAIYELVGALLTIITVSIFGGLYKDDSQWKNADPSLEWSFWVTMASVFPALLSTALYYRMGRLERKAKLGKGKKKPWLNPEHYGLLEFFTPIPTFVMFCVAMGTTHWIDSSDLDTYWGLWSKCNVTNNTSTGDREEKCDSISPGETDGYFEASRVLICFALVGYLYCVLTGFEKYETQEKKADKFIFPPVVSGAFATLLSTIIVITFAAAFQDDSFWDGLSPRLGYSFQLFASTTIIWYPAVALRLRRALILRKERLLGSANNEEKGCSKIQPYTFKPSEYSTGKRFWWMNDIMGRPKNNMEEQTETDGKDGQKEEKEKEKKEKGKREKVTKGKDKEMTKKEGESDTISQSTISIK